MYDVVLTYINQYNGYITGAEYQLSCGYIGSYLRSKNISTYQYIRKDPESLKELVSDLIQLRTENYFFYINEYNYYITRTIISHVKGYKKTAKVYIGGPSSQYIGERYMNEIEVDFCITYALPFSFYKILNEPSKEKIENIIYRKENCIVSTPQNHYSYSLDDLGLPYTSGVIPPEEIQNVGMITSTGCYGNCTFCSYKQDGACFRTHSISSILVEIEYVSHFIQGENVYLNFYDDCFSKSTERTYQICNELLKQKYKYRYWCCTRADLLNDDIIKLMSACNFKEIVLGLETASEDVMRRLGKICGNESEISYIEKVTSQYYSGLSSDLNPFVSVNFGLPFEEHNSAMKTIEYIKNNSLKYNMSVCFTTAFPGSKIFDEHESYNMHIREAPERIPFRTFYGSYMKDVLGELTSLGYEMLNYRHLNHILLEIFSGINSHLQYEKNIPYIFTKKCGISELEFISENIGLNGYVLQETENLQRSKELYSNDRKTLKNFIKRYDDNIRTAYASSLFLPNQVFYRLTKEYLLFQFNDNYVNQLTKIKIRKLASKNDYYSLAEEANLLYYANTVHIKNIQKGFVLNSCRFTKKCERDKLKRVTINGNSIMSCYDEGIQEGLNVIGNIRSSYSQMLDSVSQLNQESIDSSNCFTCCITPSCFTKSEYSEFITNNIVQLEKYVRFIVFFYKNFDSNLYSREAILHVDENNTFIFL